MSLKIPELTDTPLQVTVTAAVKTFDANIDNIGNFVLILKNLIQLASK